MDAGQGKTKAPMLAFLPRTSNAIVRAWLKYYRPVLTKVVSYAIGPAKTLACAHVAVNWFLECNAPVRVCSQERDGSTHELLGANACSATRVHRQERRATQLPRHAGTIATTHLRCCAVITSYAFVFHTGDRRSGCWPRSRRACGAVLGPATLGPIRQAVLRTTEA